MNRFFICLIVVLAAGLVCGCMDGRTPEPRAEASMLTKEHAQARSARISEVTYALEFEFDGEASEYAGKVTITFKLGDVQEDLTVDFFGGAISSVQINDRMLATSHTEQDAGDAEASDRLIVPYNGFYLSLPAQALHTGMNVVDIEFTHPYSSDSSGMYRFRDPVDERDYLYTDFEPYDQNRLFPSFDQPDLKARYSTQVSVPANWQVISVVAESSIVEQGDRKLWTFPPSAPISTYIYALHAGEYQRWEAAAGDIPLRLFARASMAEYVYPEDWFIPTRQGFEFFQRYFNIPYPFGKYDQVIVPHFNAGAMENVGAVTFSERYLRRGTVTRADRRALASVILHELAHMWFGNLVTMDWWNGLWLNESFATFMATLAMMEATEYTEARQVAYRRTISAYRADERDTTHPIEMPIADTDAAFANFDAITYSKGSATLFQLNHLVGPEAFRRGVSEYLLSHAYGNTTIDDFLGSISNAAGQDLGEWATHWLNAPGTNGVAVEFECKDGVIAMLEVIQTAPQSWPVLRTHRTQLGFYDFENGNVAVRLLPVTYSGVRTEVAAALGGHCPDFIYANHSDWDFVRVDFDAEVLATLREHLNDFDDPLIRSMLWQGAYEMVLYQRLTPMEFIDFVLANVGDESVDEVVRLALGAMQGAWSYLQHLAQYNTSREIVAARIEGYLWQAFHDSNPGSDRQLLMFDNYVYAVTSKPGLERLAGLFGAVVLPEGFVFDQDRRWNVIQRLNSFEHPDIDALLGTERRRDPSDQGRRHALSVVAALPDPGQQRRLMQQLLDPEAGLSVADARAIAGGLFPVHQNALQLEIVDEVFDKLQAVSDNIDPAYFRPIARGLLDMICHERYLEQLEQAIGRAESLHPSLRKHLLDVRFNVKRCLAIGAASTAST